MKLSIKYRYYYLAFCLLTILLGLYSRKYGEYLPVFVAKYAGDTLWASMVYWGISILWVKERIFRRSAMALLFSYCIEISQIYQADWINTIRGTTLGALVLGHGFLWSDMFCYTVGVGITALIDLTFFVNKKNI